jgi:hypothetical protein
LKLLLDAMYHAAGRHHFGMILTTDRSYSRHQGGAIGRLVTALDAWLQEHPDEADESSLIWWF